MDGVQAASAIFSGFSALSDAIGLYRAYRARGETPPAELIERKMQESENAAATQTEPAQRLGNVIDDEDLEVIRENINKAKKRLRKSMADPGNDQAAKDHAVDIADSTICAELQRIKRLNGGNLPGHEYDRWWQQHGCAA